MSDGKEALRALQRYTDYVFRSLRQLLPVEDGGRGLANIIVSDLDVLRFADPLEGDPSDVQSEAGRATRLLPEHDGKTTCAGRRQRADTSVALKWVSGSGGRAGNAFFPFARTESEFSLISCSFSPPPSGGTERAAASKVRAAVGAKGLAPDALLFAGGAAPVVLVPPASGLLVRVGGGSEARNGTCR